MRKFVLSLAAAAMTFAAATLMPSNANAAAGAPSAIPPAIADTNIAESVYWVRRCWIGYDGFQRCRRAWVDAGPRVYYGGRGWYGGRGFRGGRDFRRGDGRRGDGRRGGGRRR